jgi:hypothetical protein
MQIKRMHVLIGVALGLGSLLYFDIFGEPPASSPPAARNPAMKPMPATSGPDELAGLRLMDLNATVERPLFERTRRAASKVVPLPKPVVAAEPPPPPAPKLELLGVIISGERSLAVLTAGSSGTHLLDVGDSLGGWEVVAVNLDSVDIARGGERRKLRLTRR